MRPLRPGGLLVLSLHTADESQAHHVEQWFEHEVDLGFVLHERPPVVAAVEAAGLVDVEWYHRGPFAARAEQSERLYLLARLPARG